MAGSCESLVWNGFRRYVSLDADAAVPEIMQPNGAVSEPNKFGHTTIACGTFISVG